MKHIGTVWQDERYDRIMRNHEEFINTSITRPGQDVRYALDDTKLQSLGWRPKKIFQQEIQKIVDFYKQKFIW